MLVLKRNNEKLHGIQLKIGKNARQMKKKCTLNGKNARYSNSFIFKAHSFCSGFTVSFSTGFFLFQVTLFYFFRFIHCLHILLFGDTSTGGEGRPSFWVITQQILVGVNRRHQVCVDYLADGGNLVHVRSRKTVGHTLIHPQRAQASRHSTHHQV